MSSFLLPPALASLLQSAKPPTFDSFADFSHPPTQPNPNPHTTHATTDNSTSTSSSTSRSSRKAQGIRQRQQDGKERNLLLLFGPSARPSSSC